MYRGFLDPSLNQGEPSLNGNNTNKSSSFSTPTTPNSLLDHIDLFVVVVVKKGRGDIGIDIDISD